MSSSVQRWLIVFLAHDVSRNVLTMMCTHWNAARPAVCLYGVCVMLS